MCNGFFRAYKYFQEAADLKHTKATEMVAMALLFGDHISQDIVRYEIVILSLHTYYKLR